MEGSSGQRELSDEPTTRRRQIRRVNISDPDFSDNVRQLLHDDDDFSSEGSVIYDSDADPDFIISDDQQRGGDSEAENHYSTSEDEHNETRLLELENHNLPVGLPQNVEYQETPLKKYFLERTKKSEAGAPNAWSSLPPPTNVRVPARNIIRTLPGIRGRARTLGNKPTKRDVWELLFDKNIIDQIVINTNIKLQTVRLTLSDNTKKSNYRDTDKEEIDALIGLLLVSSVLSSNDEKINSLFKKDCFSRPIYSSAMSEKRFEILLMCLRFDDAATRIERRNQDKSAPISEIFQNFISNCKCVYSVSSDVTIDEMLVPFRGRCSFKVFMPKKPKKYGIKIMCLCDAKTSYLLNAYIYTGKSSDSMTLSEAEKKLSIPTQAVVRLCKPIQSSNRNVTADNWFGSIEVVDELQKMKLTYVGTLRKDKKLIPEEFGPNPSRPVMSSLYGFRDQATLVSFVPKKNRAVVLISTMHHTVEQNTEKKKPEIICHYNKTKCGVDLIDMKCAVYTSSRRTRRWPLAIFYRLLNIGTVNAFILFMGFRQSPLITRFDFIKSLGYELMIPHLQKRLSMPSLHRELRENIKKTLGENLPVAEIQPHGPEGQDSTLSDRLEIRKTCATCSSGKRRKTAYKCIVCKKPICLECSRKVCVNCAKDCVK